MAFVLNDRVKETTTSTGTGTINISHQTANEFEVGIGTVTDASPDTLSRDTIISSSNSDSAVNLSAGTKDVFCTYPASRAPSASMLATTYVTTHNSTLSDDQTIDSGVLAGPVTVTGTQTITGNVVII